MQVQGMVITLLHNLGAIDVEDGNSVDFWVEHLEGDEVPKLEAVAHGKWRPSVVNRCSSVMVDDGDPLVQNDTSETGQKPHRKRKKGPCPRPCH